MKVIVANPPWPGEGFGARSNVRWPHRRADKALVFPIYLAYTTALLRESGMDAKGMDAVWEEWSIPKFVERVAAESPDVVFMEVSTPSIQFDLETAARLKEKLPRALVVFMGPHATYFHSELVGHAFVDACIRGEFEMAAADICVSLKKGSSLKRVKGITFRDGRGKTVVNPDRPLLNDLDLLPLPDRKDFPLERYQQSFYCGEKAAVVISSRGCPFQCTYCLWPSTLTHRRYRMRDPRKVVDEIEALMKTEGIDEVFFDDDEFTVNREKVRQFCSEMMRRGIKIMWHCMGRVDIVDETTLKMMKEAGCYQIFYGFESGSQKILRSVKKGITTDDIRRAVKFTRKAGLVCGGSFVIGSPDESMETVKETISFARRLGADWVQFTLCAPFPGTPMYDEVKSLGLLETRTWADFDGTKGPIMRTKYLSRNQLGGIIRKAYISYYTSPWVIAQNLKKLRNAGQARRISKGAFSVLSRILYYKH